MYRTVKSTDKPAASGNSHCHPSSRTPLHCSCLHYLVCLLVINGVVVLIYDAPWVHGWHCDLIQARPTAAPATTTSPAPVARPAPAATTTCARGRSRSTGPPPRARRAPSAATWTSPRQGTPAPGGATPQGTVPAQVT